MVHVDTTITGADVLTISSFSYVHPRKHLFRLGSIPLGSDAPKFSHRSFVAFGDAYSVSTPNQIRPTHFISRPSRFITPAEMTTSFHFVLILFLFTRLVRTSSFFLGKKHSRLKLPRPTILYLAAEVKRFNFLAYGRLAGILSLWTVTNISNGYLSLEFPPWSRLILH